MASGPITSWQIDGGNNGNSDRLYCGAGGGGGRDSKKTADGDYSIEIKRCLLLGRKAMTNLDSILKAEMLLCQQTSIQSKLGFFQQSCMDVRAGLQRKLSTKELMLLNCGVGEDSSESLGQKGDQISQSYRKSVLNIHWED